MKKYAMMILLVCACCKLQAQTNFVKNPDFETYDTCPIEWGQLVYAKHWSGIVDTTGANEATPEYFNACANRITPFLSYHVPRNNIFINILTQAMEWLEPHSSMIKRRLVY